VGRRWLQQAGRCLRIISHEDDRKPCCSDGVHRIQCGELILSALALRSQPLGLRASCSPACRIRVSRQHLPPLRIGASALPPFPAVI
jgi:hypothetical protein